MIEVSPPVTGFRAAMQWAFGWAPRFGLFAWERSDECQVGTCSRRQISKQLGRRPLHFQGSITDLLSTS